MNETRKLAPAAAGRWFAPLKTTNDNNRRTVVAHPVRLFGIPSPAHRMGGRGPGWAVPAVTEPTLVLVPRTKYWHGSASARCLTRHFPPAPFAAAFRCTDYADAPAHFDGRKVPRQAWIQAGTPGGDRLAPYSRR